MMLQNTVHIYDDQLISVRIKNRIKRWSENIKHQMAKMLYVVFSEDAVMIFM
jgi:hypothetical protein